MGTAWMFEFHADKPERRRKRVYRKDMENATCVDASYKKFADSILAFECCQRYVRRVIVFCM